MPYHVSKEQFWQLVEQALSGLPPEFAAALDEVPVEVLDKPTPDMRRKLMLRQNDSLLGLYTGRALTERSVEDSGRLPDVIYIFQQPIESASNSERDLVEQVRVTVLHELGHHFGLDEDELDRLGYG